MSFINSIFDSSKGAGFQAQGANVASPVSKQQTDLAYNQSQNALYQQQDFVNALMANNGIANQGSVFNQQQALANQLGQQAQGQGPNPALAQLANSTGQNIAGQAALMAGQRGVNQNSGLLARQAAMQGAQTQQQAVGQSAVLRAQQQLAAQQALMQQQGMMGNLATTQVGQQQTGLNALNQGYQNQEATLLGSVAQANQANVANQSNVNSANAGIAAGNAKFQQGLVGGGLQGAGSMLAMADGGEVKTTVQPVSTNPSPTSEDWQRQHQWVQQGLRDAFNFGGAQKKAEGGAVEPSSYVTKYMKGFGDQMSQSNPNDQYSSGYNAGNSFMSGLAKTIGGKSGPLVQGQMGPMGSSDLMMPMGAMQMASRGGNIKDYSGGGKLPGKAEVGGDSYANDKVPIMGSPGEIMLPRSVTTHPNAPEKAKEFVAAIMARKKIGMKK